MDNLERLEENLRKKKERNVRLEQEIKKLEDKISEERDASIIRDIRALRLSREEYIRLQKSLKNRSDVLKALDKIYEMKNEGEREENVQD